MHNRASTLLIAMLLSTLASASPMTGQGAAAATLRRLPLEKRLETPVPRYDTVGRSLVEISLDLVYSYGLPMGLEYVSQSAVSQPIKLKIHNRPVRDVLAQVVDQVPGYRMTVADGLVQVYSSEAREDSSNLLNRRIKHFEVNNEDTEQASADLSCAMAREVNPHIGCFFSIAPGQWGQLKVSIDLHNARVYQILNAIVAQNGSAVWTVLVPPTKLSTSGMNLWYIYPLDPVFKRTAIDRLRALFRHE